MFYLAFLSIVKMWRKVSYIRKVADGGMCFILMKVIKQK
jgi:hypothetical protein